MSDPDLPAPPPGQPASSAKSFGNMSDAHWSRARAGANAEALSYYRARSQAPGVREGGGARNMYCMRCDGVIPLEPAVRACPHCGAGFDGEAQRYFNWVELDRPPRSDARALLPLFAAALGILTLAAALAWWLASRGGAP
ncbi:MAG: hypothetical protein JNK02_12950 [Planctomycetes bacterium]|nr:hypothetical protein [Planctomycetota bacterium]